MQNAFYCLFVLESSTKADDTEREREREREREKGRERKGRNRAANKTLVWNEILLKTNYQSDTRVKRDLIIISLINTPHSLEASVQCQYHVQSQYPGPMCPGSMCSGSTCPGSMCPDSLCPESICPDSLCPGSMCPGSSRDLVLVPGVPIHVWCLYSSSVSPDVPMKGPLVSSPVPSSSGQ